MASKVKKTATQNAFLSHEKRFVGQAQMLLLEFWFAVVALGQDDEDYEIGDEGRVNWAAFGRDMAEVSAFGLEANSIRQYCAAAEVLLECGVAPTECSTVKEMLDRAKQVRSGEKPARKSTKRVTKKDKARQDLSARLKKSGLSRQAKRELLEELLASL